MDDDEVQFEMWSRVTSNHMLFAAEGFRQMCFHAPEGAEIGRMIQNIDMLLLEAQLWQPDGAEWPKAGEQTAEIYDFTTKQRINA
jgi:regulator of sirC expression with transglutaminase-like and TPR domain